MIQFIYIHRHRRKPLGCQQVCFIGVELSDRQSILFLISSAVLILMSAKQIAKFIPLRYAIDILLGCNAANAFFFVRILKWTYEKFR